MSMAKKRKSAAALMRLAAGLAAAISVASLPATAQTTAVQPGAKAPGSPTAKGVARPNPGAGKQTVVRPNCNLTKKGIVRPNCNLTKKGIVRPNCNLTKKGIVRPNCNLPRKGVVTPNCNLTKKTRGLKK